MAQVKNIAERTATAATSIPPGTTSILQATASIRRGNVAWLPTAVVLAVALIAGSRLIDLSVRHHAAAARETAATVVNTSVRKIEPLLQKLADLAERQAAAGRAGRLGANGGQDFLDDERRQSAGFPAGRGRHRKRHCRRMAVGGVHPHRTWLRRSGSDASGSLWLMAVRFPIAGRILWRYPDRGLGRLPTLTWMS